MILQKLKYSLKSDVETAEKYLGVISVVNDLYLTKREVQLLAFTAIRGNIGSATAKKEYVDTYDSSLATVGNMISKLTKKHLLQKVENKVILNKALDLGFEEGLNILITLENVGETR